MGRHLRVSIVDLPGYVALPYFDASYGASYNVKDDSDDDLRGVGGNRWSCSHGKL